MRTKYTYLNQLQQQELEACVTVPGKLGLHAHSEIQEMHCD